MVSYTPGTPWTRRPAARHLARPAAGDPGRASAGGLTGGVGRVLVRTTVEVCEAVGPRDALTVVVGTRDALTVVVGTRLAA